MLMAKFLSKRGHLGIIGKPAQRPVEKVQKVIQEDVPQTITVEEVQDRPENVLKNPVLVRLLLNSTEMSDQSLVA